MYLMHIKLKNRTEIVKFYSLWSATIMAKEYATCIDVMGIEIVDNTTGELLLAMGGDGSYSYMSDEYKF